MRSCRESCGGSHGTRSPTPSGHLGPTLRTNDQRMTSPKNSRRSWLHRPGIPLDTQLGMIPLRSEHEMKKGSLLKWAGNPARLLSLIREVVKPR